MLLMINKKKNASVSHFTVIYALLCHQYFKIYHALKRRFCINLIYDIGSFNY